jgi:diguanylate cyclase (GGDEF)-like protein
VKSKASMAMGIYQDLPPGLRTAVLRVTAQGEIGYCNAAAKDMLLGPEVIGARFDDLLEKAEKLGRIVPGTAARILDAAAPAKVGGTERFTLLDGRLILMATSEEANGVLVEWADVTPFVEALRSQERDPLTGMLARPSLVREISAVVSGGEPAALLYIDLDRFTGVNTMLGHLVGDNLLKKVAGRIVGLMGHGDAVARIGGDEFVVLRRADKQAAVATAHTLQDMLARPFIVDGQIVHIGASIGLAFTQGNEAPDDLIRNARLALLKAKAEGGGSVQHFTDEMRDDLQRRRLLETDLRQAMALREFSLAFQPQYQIEGRRLIGFEALLRWQHPRRGNVSPAEFIPLAEDLGLIVPLGEWALRAACKTAAAWPLPLSISVNISPLQFRSPNIVAAVSSALAASGLDPSRLELEVTEGALLLNSEPVMNIFRQIKALGVRFAMDDFGTGYSSLSYLQKFPFDKIKIDQSFVRNLPGSADGIAIVRAVSALGSSLGLSIIAEGVETEEQLASISLNGCKEVQGYLTGRPLAPEAAEALVTSAVEATVQQQEGRP